MTYVNALTALADPTRRAVFESLRAGPAAVGAIAARLPAPQGAEASGPRGRSRGGHTARVLDRSRRSRPLAPLARRILDGCARCIQERSGTHRTVRGVAK